MGGRGGPAHKSINTHKHPVDFLPDVHEPKMILWLLFFFPPDWSRSVQLGDPLQASSADRKLHCD